MEEEKGLGRGRRKTDGNEGRKGIGRKEIRQRNKKRGVE